MYYTRSRAATEYKSAGVLPFALAGAEVVVLLGAEVTKTGPKGKFQKHMWRDFGGAREAADADSAATAAREFGEETLGLFGGCSVDQAAVEACAAATAERLRDPRKALRVVHVLKRGEYHMYLTQVCFISPLMFRLATQQNAATGAVQGGEKTAFAWVPLSDLLRAVHEPRGRYYLQCKSAACGGAGTPPPLRSGLREFHLHPCFAHSMQLAQECGLAELLSRAQALPLPPAPPLPLLLSCAGAVDATLGAEAAAAAGPAAQQAQQGAACSSDSEGSGDSCTAQEGPTPGHMTYWLAQEAIALELRCPGDANAAAAAAAACKEEGPAVGAAAGAGAGGAAPLAGRREEEPTASHASSASIAPVQLAGVAAAAATAAAIAAVVAAAAEGGQLAGDKARQGGKARRRRSRKQRQQRRQRQRRQREQELLKQQQAQQAQQGEAHLQQEQQQDGERRADYDAAASSGCEQGSGQAHAALGVPPPPPPPPPSPRSGYWAAAEEGLARLLPPQASPRKRIRLY